MSRETPAPIQKAFEIARATPSDINEHMDLLRELASECEHVTEMGMRTGVSTLALLAAQPAELISWDIDARAVLAERNMARALNAGRTFFQPRVGDTRKIIIEPTEMLFIDTLHTFTQLKAELFRHCVGTPDTPQTLKSVSKYLVFHDTVTFGFTGEDRSAPGLRAAINIFLKNTFPLWHPIHDREFNNGLVVLKRTTP